MVAELFVFTILAVAASVYSVLPVSDSSGYSIVLAAIFHQLPYQERALSWFPT